MKDFFKKEEEDFEKHVKELSNPYFEDNADGDTAYFGYKTTRTLEDGSKELFTITDFGNIQDWFRSHDKRIMEKMNEQHHDDMDRNAVHVRNAVIKEIVEMVEKKRIVMFDRTAVSNEDVAKKHNKIINDLLTSLKGD